MRFSSVTMVLFLAMTLNLVSCGSKPKQKDPFQTERNTINNLLTSWHNAASRANFEDYFNLISEDGMYIGTDQDEVWTKKEFAAFAKPYFDKGRAWEFKAIKRNIYFSGNPKTAWFDETLNTWMGVCRGSGVLKYDESSKSYKIQHYVLSLTVPNEVIRDVMEVIEKN